MSKWFVLEGKNETLSEYNWKLVDLQTIQSTAMRNFGDLFKP
jgi:hypothetical protein